MPHAKRPDPKRLASHPKDFGRDPACPFPVGVEYYRPPVPPPRFWEGDFASIRAAGMRIVRIFLPWNWVETGPGHFELDDLDLFFELAEKHDLKVWVDTCVATHLACPEWMLREHPDMAVELADGRKQHMIPAPCAPHGLMTHNVDHPKWREYAERYIRALVGRYKDHPAMLVWGTQDGANITAAWSTGSQLPYNDYTIEKYKNWLKQRYTLDELNERLLRRYRCWEDMAPPRNAAALVEMKLYREFHYENLADELGWLADLIDRVDGRHEQRSHGGHYPRQMDEICSARVDGWGLSLPSAGYLTGEDPYGGISDICFGFVWSRAVGRNGRWWTEEIYSNFTGGLKPYCKATTPEEATLFLWLSLIEGAAGALYWQYRPEYMTFEAPGLNLASLDGAPTARLDAVEQAIRRIDAMAPHLPLAVPESELAIGYSAASHEIYYYANRENWFHEQLRGVYRSLWADSIPADIVTPSMDWSAYKVVYLPGFALPDDAATARIRDLLEDPHGPRILADGHFGSFAAKGHWSFCPPEGLADVIDVQVQDFDYVSDRDIRFGKNVLKTEFGEFAVTQTCQYAVLSPGPNARAVATIDGNTVGVEAADGRILWFGVPLAVTGEHRADPELTRALFGSLGIGAPVAVQGDRLVAFKRRSRLGGSLVFLANLEHDRGRAVVKPDWPYESARLLPSGRDLELRDGGFEVEVPFGDVCVIYCE